MKSDPTLDDLVGCRVESVELFADSLQLKLSKGERTFVLSTLGNIDLGDEGLSDSYLSDDAAIRIRDIVESEIGRLSYCDDVIWIHFEDGRPLRIRPAKGADYLLSYREELGTSLGSEIFEG